jgi:NitT/TauT family transport system permease protein
MALLWRPFLIFSRNMSRAQKNLDYWHSLLDTIIEYMLYAAGIALIILSCYRYMTIFSIGEILYVFKLGFITSCKILIIVMISALIWLPIGVWIGCHKKIAQMMQPIIQFLAAYPPQMLYPFITAAIIHYKLNVDIWTAPIMILGTQWYILFNVIAGTMMITKEQRFAAANMGVKSFLLWKRVYLPAVMPYCITGCLSASGGCWNVSLNTDTLEWGTTKITAIGISSYIENSFSSGALDKAVLGVSVMTCYVLLINRFLWNPLIQRVTAHHR